jgi:hypothetical protein
MAYLRNVWYGTGRIPKATAVKAYPVGVRERRALEAILLAEWAATAASAT